MSKKLLVSIFFYILPICMFSTIESKEFKSKESEFISDSLVKIPYLEQESISDPHKDRSISDSSISKEEEETDDVALNTSQEIPSQNMVSPNILPIETQNDLKPITTQEVNVEEVSQNNEPLSDTFPINTTVGYDLEKDSSQYFIEASGSDTLNKDLDRKINFLIRLPAFESADDTTRFNAAPNKFYFNLSDRHLDLMVGDSKYQVSPLIMNDFEARGGKLQVTPSPVSGVSILYTLATHNDEDYPADKFGTSLFIKPLSFITLSSNFLFTQFEDNEVYSLKNNYTYSLRSLFEVENTKLDLEYANSNTFERKNSAVFASLNGKNDVLSYDLDYLYANPTYVGDVSDKVTLDGLVQLNLDKLSLKALHKREKTNLERSILKEKSLRKVDSEFSITYPLISDIKTTLGFNKKGSKNLLKNDGFKLNAINLATSIPVSDYSFDNSIEVGRYKSRIEGYIPRTWKNTKFSVNYSPLEDNKISLYSKLGNIIHDDIFTTSYAFGTDLKLKPSSNLELVLAYEYSINHKRTDVILDNTLMKWNNHYFKEDLVYTLPNEHKIILTSHINKPLSHKKEKAFLLTYTVPLKVPTINRSVNTVRGRFLEK